MKKKSKYWRIVLILVILSVLSAVTCFFPSACDWFTDNIHGIVSGGIARVTGLLPVSVGEIILMIGAAMLVLGILFLILLIFLRKKAGYRKFCAGWFKTWLMGFVIVLFLSMPTWLIPLCGHVLGKDNAGKRTDYSVKELTALYAYTIEGLNKAAAEIEIAADGSVQFPTDEELQPHITEALTALSGEYPRLAGYYPPVKIALTSDFYSRMNIGGFTFPPSAEATRDKYSLPYFIPVLNAHELSHVKGFMKENEANFISQLALSKSDNPYLRFSAFDNMRSYVYEKWQPASEAYLNTLAERGEITLPVMPEIRKGMSQEERVQLKKSIEERERITQEVFRLPDISERAYQIYNAAHGVREQVYNEDSHPVDNMPAVQEALETVNKAHWDLYDIYMQENSYDGVVLLLLQHFEGMY